MKGFMNEIGIIAAGIIGLAIVAVILGQNAKTVEVVTAAGGVFVNSIKAAVSPVT